LLRVGQGNMESVEPGHILLEVCAAWKKKEEERVEHGREMGA
jgi:hypothetical protein